MIGGGGDFLRGGLMVDGTIVGKHEVFQSEGLYETGKQKGEPSEVRRSGKVLSGVGLSEVGKKRDLRSVVVGAGGELVGEGQPRFW